MALSREVCYGHEVRLSAFPTLVKRQRVWVPWLMGGLVACVVLIGWEALDRREKADLQRSTSIVLDWVQKAIVRDLDQRMSSLRRIADRLSYSGGMSRAAWEVEISNYLADQPGYHSIEWNDSRFQERWVMPAEALDGSSLKDDNARLSPRFLDTHLPDLSKPALSSVLKLDQQRTGFFAYQPIESEGQFKGSLVAVFEFDTWLDYLTNGSTEDLFGMQVLMENQRVFDSATSPAVVVEEQVQERTLSTYERTWTVRVWLSGTRIAENQSLISNALLWMGLLLSALLVWALRATQISRAKSLDLQVHSLQLEAQWKNLPGMAYRSSAGEGASIEFVSDGCLELTGYHKGDFLEGKVHWNDVVHEDKRQMRISQIKAAMSSRQSYRGEYRITCRNGDEKWVWESGNVSESPLDHSPVIEGLVLDISEQKHTQAALTVATTYAKTLVDTAAEAIITISTRGNIESVNRSAEEMFGYSRHELVGNTIGMLMPEPLRSEHDTYLQRYLKTNEKRIIGTGRDVMARRKDGSALSIRLSVSEFMSEDGCKFVGLVRDLTQQRLAEQEASMHRERLAHVARVNMLGEMATGIAHEINQPLSAISMYAQSGLRFLDADLPKPERLREALEKLSVQAHRAGAVIERMQQFARQRESRYESIDCNQLMQEVAHLAESEALIRDAEISLEIDTRIQKVFGDPIQLQQVALNLLRNGMESMESIGHRYGNRIILSTEDEQSSLRVSIIDQGTGVSMEAAEQLYKPFASTKDMGMGIGLSICKSIIHSHGGQLDFVNAEGHGATFFFTLPYTE